MTKRHIKFLSVLHGEVCLLYSENISAQEF
jgi:hypothetical protein